MILMLLFQGAAASLGWNDICVFKLNEPPNCFLFQANPSPYGSLSTILSTSLLCGKGCVLNLCAGLCLSDCLNTTCLGNATFLIDQTVIITGNNTQIYGNSNNILLTSRSSPVEGCAVFSVQAWNVNISDIIFLNASIPCNPVPFISNAVPLIYQKGGYVSLTNIHSTAAYPVAVFALMPLDTIALTTNGVTSADPQYAIVLGPSVLTSAVCAPLDAILFSGSKNIVVVSDFTSTCPLLDMVSDLILGVNLNLFPCVRPPSIPTDSSACEKKANEILFIVLGVLGGLLAILLSICLELSHKAALRTRNGVSTHTQQKIKQN